MASFKIHCVLGFAIRLILVIYANFHDLAFNVPYTDVDYRVYTDASRLIVNGSSPFDRHTYRYTPLLAFLLTPNIFLHRDFGKVLFSIVDVFVTVLTKIILVRMNCPRRTAKLLALAWLYNPLTIVVTTRGNADSLAAMFVLGTLYLLHRDRPISSGLLHGLSIHFRLYPIAFSLPMYLSLRGKNYLPPSSNQLKLVFSCVASLLAFTAVSYYFYGWKYLYESMIYHLVRKDARHNFSVFFYMTYLSIGADANILTRLLTVLPQFLLLVGLSFRYSTKNELSFGMLVQAIVMVTYNPVMTSQYFFWFLSILPLCVPYIKISGRKWLTLTIFWLLGQGLWLFDAWTLEFKGSNAFYRIWLDGVVFFIINLKILEEMIKNYHGNICNDKFMID